MPGSLLLSGGVLYVGSEAKTASVRAFDLDGRALGVRFRFRDEGAGRSAAAGLAIDDEHRLWVADEAAHRVRAFNLFGVEVDALVGEPDAPDAPGRLAAPRAVVVLPPGHLGQGAEGPRPELLAVACGGVRRHALQLFDPETKARVAGLRPPEGPRSRFRDLVHLRVREERLFACERGTGRVLVYLRGSFHYALGPWDAELRACEPLADGRLVVCAGGEPGRVLVVDGSGAPLRTLASGGDAEGQVDGPCDVVVEPGRDDRHTRVAVLDREGDRVQVFSLAGRCFGAFTGLAG